MFWSKNKIIGVPLHIPVCYIKVGFKGVYITRTWFRGDNVASSRSHETIKYLDFFSFFFFFFFPGRDQYYEVVWLVLLSREHPEAQPSRRLFLLLFLGEARDRTCDPWFTRRVTYPLHNGGFSLTYAIIK